MIEMTGSAMWWNRPWKLAAAWLCFLAPFFFVTYIGALEITSWRSSVPVLVFDWEKHIPFLAWTIVPYWSIDLLYGLSLFLSVDREELNRHGLRLLSAQLIAVTIFLVAPLRLVSTIPPERGIFSPWFAALDQVVSKPFNLAPSLHIALLVILWVHYARHVPRKWHWIMHGWALLIAVSVMTTYQHHFFDVPTGAALGFFCIWLWPDEGGSPMRGVKIAAGRRRRQLALYYLLGTGILTGMAWYFSGIALWLLWPAFSLFMVSLAYGALGPALFQKNNQGQMSLAARILLLPYIQGVRINIWAWTRHLPASVQVAGAVHIGRFPRRADAATHHVVDLAAELPAPARNPLWHSIPMLDLVPPDPADLCRAARMLEEICRSQKCRGQTVLTCCALGFSRSAAAVVSWLAAYGRADSVDRAIAIVHRARPQIVLGQDIREAITRAVRILQAEQSGIPDNRLLSGLSENSGNREPTL